MNFFDQIYTIGCLKDIIHENIAKNIPHIFTLLSTFYEWLKMLKHIDFFFFLQRLCVLHIILNNSFSKSFFNE